FSRNARECSAAGSAYGPAGKSRSTIPAYGTHPPNKEYEKWDGELFSYSPRRGGRKKQNPVSLGDTPRVPEGHIRKANGTNSVCAPEGHIGEAPKCAPEGHISRLPSESVAITGCEGAAGVKGSSTVRAPAQAGDAQEVRGIGHSLEVLGSFCYVERGSVVRNGSERKFRHSLELRIAKQCRGKKDNPATR